MRFFVEKIREKDVRVFVKQKMDKVHVMAEDHTGRTWILFSLLNDGTFRRPKHIDKNLGIAVDSNGRIIESK